jgi:hypothetical protein
MELTQTFSIWSSQNNVEQYTTEKARRDYGSYASEILEEQQTTQEDAQTHLNET